MKNLMTMILAVILTACYDTDRLNGDSVECSTDCDDEDPCTQDVCDFEGECQHFPIPDCLECDHDSDCMDEDPCTQGTCVDNACVQTPSEDPECTPECYSHPDCDDGDECTMDVCGFDGECMHDEICTEGVDLDGDGYAYPDDCDDRRVDVYPGAEELCDIIRDNDCDGEVDEDACEYNCPVSYGYCAIDVEPEQVSISLGNLSSCHPDSSGPWRQDGSGFYTMEFLVQNLNAGDVIQYLEISQTAGTIPLPEAGAEPARAMLKLVGNLEGGSASFWLANLPQHDDGSFIFEDITIPVDLDSSVSLLVEVLIPYTYSGYMQFGLLELGDFIVRDKVTVTERCTSEPQLGHFIMVLCPDWDNDGHDNHFCGGDDTHDGDPTSL